MTAKIDCPVNFVKDARLFRQNLFQCRAPTGGPTIHNHKALNTLQVTT